MKFTYMTMIVADLEASVDFYRTMAGLEVANRFKAGSGEIAFMQGEPGSTMIELVQMPGMQKVETVGLNICFETDNITAAYAKASAYGLEPSEIRRPDENSKYFYVYDPDRVSIEFVEHKK